VIPLLVPDAAANGPPMLEDCCHKYVKEPLPPVGEAVFVSTPGSPPVHIVWGLPIEPPVTGVSVLNSITLENTSLQFPELTLLLNQVLVTKAGGL
jgi:hypothetical protein